MYFDFMLNWIYRVMQLPVPIVTAPNVYGLVTIFDIFLFTVYIAVFIILIRYIITDNLSLKVGEVDINYSSNAYLPKHMNNIRRKTNDKKESANNANNN